MESFFQLPDDVPSVLQNVVDDACWASVSEVKGRMSGFSLRLVFDESWPAWIIQLAPEPGELVGGEDDGAKIFDHVDIDLLALPRCVDDVESFSFDPGMPHLEEGPHVQLVGTKQECHVVVQIYLYPFRDDSTGWVFDANQGQWRPPKGDETRFGDE